VIAFVRADAVVATRYCGGKAKRDRLLERCGGAARTGGKGLDPCKPIHLSQSAAARIASARQDGVSAMSRAEIVILDDTNLTKSQ